MSSNMQAKDVSELLAQSAESIAKLLYPNGTKHGNEWCIGNVLGDAGNSLKIVTSGTKMGVWSDFATGESGDLLDLWAKRYNIPLGLAMQDACKFLDIKRPMFAHAPRKKVFAKPSQELAPIGVLSPVMQYLSVQRKLTPQTIKTYQISEKDGYALYPYIRDGEVIFLKFIAIELKNGKKDVRTITNCEPCLFGWHVLDPNARSVTICEGEIDAMSLHQFGINALSVPFGGGKGKKQQWLEYEFDRLAVFDEIFICMDNDDEGRIAAKEIIDRLGAHRCRLVELPLKDANMCLQEGMTSEMMAGFFAEALSLDPEELKKNHDFLEETIDSFYPPDGIVQGYEAPWQKTHDKILFRPNELSVWGGLNGHGKTQFLGQLVLSMMGQGARVCIASFELRIPLLLKRMYRQASAMALPSVEYIRAIDEHYDSLWMFDLVGNARSERLLEVFLYARRRYGIDVFVIDSLMMLDIAEDDYKAQKSLMEKLCHFKNHNDCQVHIVVHPRKGADESVVPGKLDYKGTGAISDLADNCFTLWRNKAKEIALQSQSQGAILSQKESDSIQKPDALWFCDKQRHGDWEGGFGFWFDKASYQYLEGENVNPKPFVQYSCLA